MFDKEDLEEVPETVSYTTHAVDSIVNNSEADIGSKWISNAAEKRKLSMFAQLSKMLQSNQNCFNYVTPFVAPIDNIRMVVYDEEYSQHEQPLNIDLLNGNLVYLCQSKDGELLNTNSILDCHGVGIVRGIDKINKQIYLLLPQNDKTKELQSLVNVLAIGNIPMPAEILLKQSFEVTGKIPHLTLFMDKNVSSSKYVNKKKIKDCF